MAAAGPVATAAVAPVAAARTGAAPGAGTGRTLPVAGVPGGRGTGWGVTLGAWAAGSEVRSGALPAHSRSLRTSRAWEK